MHGSSYFYGVWKKFLATYFCLTLKITYFYDISIKLPIVMKVCFNLFTLFLLYYNCYIYVYCALVCHYGFSNILQRMKTVNKMWWQNYFFSNYIFEQNIILHVKGKTKDIHCCYLAFLVFYVFLSRNIFSSFFWLFSSFSWYFLHPSPSTKKTMILSKSHSNMTLIQDS